MNTQSNDQQKLHALLAAQQNIDDMKKLFAAQRARRIARAPVSHLIVVSERKVGEKNTLVLMIVLMFVISIAGAYEYVTLTYHPEASPLPVSASASLETVIPTNIMLTATPATGKVCTNVPQGRLHVRVAPGEGNVEVGYLTEGEAVTIITNVQPQTAPDGGTWIKISAPLSGWVNQTYVCEEK